MTPGTDAESSTLFDGFVESYEDACARGLALSGESRDYFARRRVALTRELCATQPIHRLIDFGCGLGHTTPYLTDAFADAAIVGIDTASSAIDAARRQYGTSQVSFAIPHEHPRDDDAALVYTNGTFHHIEPEDRDAAVRAIYEWLAPGGTLALWENNPWNPGTRLVMSRIPFDRDAKPLSPPTAVAMVRRGGFEVLSVSSHFYFPSWLKLLRPLENWLVRLPLGSQYCVLARRPARDR
jgi:SAM-dependent methyltransferase